MSSAILTDVRPHGGKPAPPAPAPPETGAPGALARTAFFFLITACAVATVAVVLLRGSEAAALVFVVITILAAGLTGVALYRTLIPLSGASIDETPMLGGRTRAALERDKMLTLRAIKELEFDRAMGKVSEPDFEEMRNRLRARALRLMRQLEGGDLYRQLIEQEVAQRMAAPPAPPEAPAEPACLACGTANDADARFCKQCGQPLAGGGVA